jgi:DNA ligase (NAD+)
MTRIQELEKDIQKYRQAYYSGNEKISDAEYDRLESELRMLDPNNTILNSIGQEKPGNWSKRDHRMKMGSQAKAADKAEFQKWFSGMNDKVYVCEEKIDGSSLELQYDNGKLVAGVTRGDGIIGEDITKNIRRIPSIVQNLPYKMTGSIRGEVVMLNSTFETKYAKISANPRNMTAGILKRLDSKGCEDLVFIAYDTHPSQRTEFEKMKFLETNGFIVPKYCAFNIIDKNKTYGEICAWRDDMMCIRGDLKSGASDYNYDGIVVKCNTVHDKDLARDRPTTQIAFKFDLDTAVSEIIDVEWYPNGRTRTPVAIIKPVILNGTTVTHATLHNPRIFDSFNIHVGTIVHVQKGGEIIPKIIKAINNENIGKKIRYPKTCEFCGSMLIRTDSELYCQNVQCIAIKAHNVAKWIEIHGIQFIGDAGLWAMIRSGLVKDQADLYKLTPDILVQKAGFGQTMADKIYNEIQTKGRSTTLVKFIAGLDIPNVGERLMKNIQKGLHLQGIDDLMLCKAWEIAEINGIGDIMSTVLCEGLKDNKKLIQKLMNYVTFKDTDLPNGGKLYGKTIVVTGFIQGHTRAEIEFMIEKAGGSVGSSVTNSTSYLVTDENNLSTKRAKAEKLNIPIITSQILFSMM